MIANIFKRYLPTPDRVAAFAVGAELTAMYVCVAIGAVRTHVLEYRAGVAPGAIDFLVHAAQWVAGLVVIEFGV